jgi:hypothetical protein
MLISFSIDCISHASEYLHQITHKPYRSGQQSYKYKHIGYIYYTHANLD